MGFTDVLFADDSFFFFLHRCRCEETSDEAEEQGDIFRYRNDFSFACLMPSSDYNKDL